MNKSVTEDSRELSEKRKAQEKIRSLYGVKLLEKQSELCRHCELHNIGGCRFLLLPVTLRGDDCPYFYQRPAEAY